MQDSPVVGSDYNREIEINLKVNIHESKALEELCHQYLLSPKVAGQLNEAIRNALREVFDSRGISLPGGDK